jgi:hypothetical protein
MLAVIVTASGLALTGVVGRQPRPALSGSPSPVPTARAGLVRFNDNGLSFEYPAWKYFSAAGLSLGSFETPVGFLATFDLDLSKFCQTTGNATSCGYLPPLAPGNLLVEIVNAGGFDSPLWHDVTPSGQERVMVAGMPALYSEQHLATGVDALIWQIARPDAFDNYFIFTAQIKGPGEDDLRSQVQALVASVGFSPPVAGLSTDPAAAGQAAASGLAALRALKPEGPTYACFPDVPGTSQTATIRSFPDQPLFPKPLPVECSMTIEPTDLQQWKMTLEFSWTAAPDRRAGRWVITQWVTRNGELGAQEATGETQPYR